MKTISIRINDEDFKLLHEYVAINQLNLSQFVREAVMDRIEEDFALDEERILRAHERAKNEKKYDHTEVWKMLGNKKPGRL